MRKFDDWSKALRQFPVEPDRETQDGYVHIYIYIYIHTDDMFSHVFMCAYIYIYLCIHTGDPVSRSQVSTSAWNPALSIVLHRYSEQKHLCTCG